MSTNHLFNMDTRMGTWSGTLLVVLATISAGELLKTMILAAVGAVVSFLVSWLLKWSVSRYKIKRNKGRQPHR
jgi:mannitol-specific phosphotransferase system IIBC component